MTPKVDVVQHGTSSRHTARCDCGWQTSVGSMKAAQNLAQEHRQAGCTGPAPTTDVVPAAPATVEPASPWTGEQTDLIRQQVCPGATDTELAFFAQVCRHRQLDPFAGEIVGIMRYDKKAGRGVMKIQPTVEGLRTIAMRTGLYAGQDEILWCGPDGGWRDIWPDPKRPPYAAKAAVYRSDVNRPFPGKAHYHEFVQLDGGGRPTPMWNKMPANQLAKCAERQALIRAFKKELQAVGFDLEEDLPAQSRISMEARQAGLDDDGRHALVAEVTGGRTESTRDLTDDEVLEVRAEVARRADPATGEIGEPDAVARTIARGGDLEQRLEQLTAEQTEQLEEWRRSVGLTRPVGTLNAADRTQIVAELNHRDEHCWAQPAQPADADEIGEDVIEPDLFDDDEPF